MDNLNERVIKTLLQIKKSAENHLDSKKLVTDGILDSLDIMRLIMELEFKFDIAIDPADVLSDNFESVDAMVALVEKCKK